MILSQAKDTRGPLNLFIFVLFILIRKCLTVSTIDEPHSRQKRWFIEPGNCAGITAAVVLPTDDRERSVFVAIAFSTGFTVFEKISDFQSPEGQPISEGTTPGTTTTKQHRFGRAATVQTTTQSTKGPNDVIKDKTIGKSERRIQLSRRMLYKAWRIKLNSYGFDGLHCLLRAICEAAETPLGPENGVLGDILHIILSPSTSRAENLNDAYYEAETAGRESNCQLYAEKCPLSILDLISIYKK